MTVIHDCKQYPKDILFFSIFTVKVLSAGTNWSEQTMQAQIRLLLLEQSDQDLHCLLFHPTFLGAFWQCKTIPLHFYNNNGYYNSVPIFRIFMVAFSKASTIHGEKYLLFFFFFCLV